MNKKPATLMLEDMTVSVPDSVLFQKVDDEIVLLNIASGEYYGLNEIGARVWTLLREGRSTHEVLDALLKEYDVSTERLSADIQQFLLALQSRGLVEVVADPKV